MEKYGKDHKEAKAERLKINGNNKCEVTGSGGNMDSHHNSPKCFDGNDSVGNSLILADHFHQYLHKVAYVSSPEQFAVRSAEAKKFWNEPLSIYASKAKAKIQEIDRGLMLQYVTKLLTSFHADLQSILTIKTVVRNMETIRDLRFENHEIKKELEMYKQRFGELNTTKIIRVK